MNTNEQLNVTAVVAGLVVALIGLFGFLSIVAEIVTGAL